LVLAAICDVAVEVAEGEKSELKVIFPEVDEVQFTATVAPVQKIRLSGIVPVRTIGFAVLAATTPVSSGVGEPVFGFVVV
jgi:hypothetical protein